jgi:hypothetical protein
MKRTSYDSEYDKVRRAAAPRAAPQPKPMDRVMTPREADRAQVQDIIDEMHAREQEREEAERVARQERNVEDAKRSAEFNRRAILREYSERGLAPPYPLVALETLLFCGWKIVEGRLERPPPPPTKEEREARRKSYSNDGGT